MTTVSKFALFTEALRRLGSVGYRLAFFAAGLFLLWRGFGATERTVAIMGIGLGSLCILQFGVLAVIDYRRARRRLRSAPAISRPQSDKRYH